MLRITITYNHFQPMEHIILSLNFFAFNYEKEKKAAQNDTLKEEHRNPLAGQCSLIITCHSKNQTIHIEAEGFGTKSTLPLYTS